MSKLNLIIVFFFLITQLTMLLSAQCQIIWLCSTRLLDTSAGLDMSNLLTRTLRPFLRHWREDSLVYS